METFGEWKRTDNLTEWFTQSKSEAGWDINVLKDGPYVVTVEYACTEEDQGSEWLIKSATDSLAFSSLESGCRRANAEGKAPRMRYLKRELGVINLQVGRQALRMMPKTGSSPGNIHLRQIKLEPWE